ncbi:MAG: hypothetical protein KAI97_09335, partial [Gemmatimonadetes bacterium]|nr:hypothetical protein [Gemmatimonadota bacterium]
MNRRQDPHAVPLFDHEGQNGVGGMETLPVRHEEEMGDAVEIKSRIHRRLLERLNLSNLEAYARDEVVVEIRKVVHDLLDEESTPLNYDERESLIEQVIDEIFGLGPLEPLVNDPTISDILVNTYSQIFVEKFGKLELTNGRFKDDEHLMKI